MSYATTAAALGAGWFVVLLIPRTSREWLLADPWPNLACLTVAGVVVAFALRGLIGGGGSLRGQLWRGALIPYAGCLVYLSLWVALLWTRHFLSGGLANLHDTASVYVMGMTAAALSCYVVVPYGLLCQVVLSSIAARSPARGH